MEARGSRRTQPWGGDLYGILSLPIIHSKPKMGQGVGKPKEITAKLCPAPSIKVPKRQQEDAPESLIQTVPSQMGAPCWDYKHGHQLSGSPCQRSGMGIFPV